MERNAESFEWKNPFIEKCDRLEGKILLAALYWERDLKKWEKASTEELISIGGLSAAADWVVSGTSHFGDGIDDADGRSIMRLATLTDHSGIPEAVWSRPDAAWIRKVEGGLRLFSSQALSPLADVGRRVATSAFLLTGPSITAAACLAGAAWLSPILAGAWLLWIGRLGASVADSSSVRGIPHAARAARSARNERELSRLRETSTAKWISGRAERQLGTTGLPDPRGVYGPSQKELSDVERLAELESVSMTRIVPEKSRSIPKRRL